MVVPTNLIVDNTLNPLNFTVQLTFNNLAVGSYAGGTLVKLSSPWFNFNNTFDNNSIRLCGGLVVSP